MLRARPHRRLLAAQALLLIAGVTVAAASGARPLPVATPSAPSAALLSAVQVPDRAPVLPGPAAQAAPPAAPATAGRAAPTAPPAARRSRAASRSRGSSPLTPEQRGRAALAALGYPWQSLGYRVVFRPYSGGLLGHADPRDRTVTVYVKPAQDETELRATIAHELGHVLDFVHGTEDRRRRYRELRGLPGSSAWFPCAGCDDLASPAGDWAEVFAAHLVGTGDFRSRLAGPPSAQDLQRLAPLFAVPAPPPPPPAQAEPEPEEDGGLLPLIGGRGMLA